MSRRPEVFESALVQFPVEVRVLLLTIPDHGGGLRAADVEKVMQLLGTSLNRLMIDLLPAAAAFAAAPISAYRVGAVVAGVPGGVGAPSLYLGANFEVVEEALSLTVHAEQTATMNAWQNGETGVSTLAVSAPPCGHCRQFLHELTSVRNLRILLPADRSGREEEVMLTDLLPRAFGPCDLGVEGSLMAAGCGPAGLVLDEDPRDDFSRQALEAARMSYAPYTGAYSGCALLTGDGRVHLGRYAENAAYNPSLSPLQVAAALMNMSATGGGMQEILRAALVERAAKTSHRRLTQHLLDRLAPGITLEYHSAHEQTLGPAPTLT